jgi:flagella basal body P-ring formation protein FlgA
MVLCSGAFPAANVTTVTLSAETEVQPARPVAIKDIARVDGPKEMAQRIGGMTIATGPMPGKRSKIQTDFVRLRLRAETKTKIEVRGPERVELVGKCLRFSPQTIADEAQSFVTDQLPEDACTYEVTVSRAPREIVVAGGAASELRPRLLNPTLRPGPIAVAVDVLVDGNVAAAASVSMTLKASADALVATRAIRQSEALTSENTAWDRRDVTNKPNALTQSQGNAMDWIARRALSAGVLITGNDVAPPFVVRRGETASVTVTCGRITLRTTGEIKQDARTGELVRVRPADAAEDMQATVLGPGLVGVTR